MAHSTFEAETTPAEKHAHSVEIDLPDWDEDEMADALSEIVVQIIVDKRKGKI